MAWREHAEDYMPCWCTERYPASVNDVVVGEAIPLDNGSYSVEFFKNDLGKNGELLVNQGASITFLDQEFSSKP